MKHLWTITALMTLALVPACTDYATFVTATDIGINLDATTEQLNIGYARAELFHGPGYPSEGAAPSAVGYINSDLSPFSPMIKQLYATGTAAELVTQNEEPGSAKESGDKLEGQRRPLFFGTGTNFGLKVGFAGDVPSSVRLGFNREEVSIIPMQRADPRSGQQDKYASVLAAISMDNTIAGRQGTSVKPTQFFATGAAARNLAKRDDIRGYFHTQAKEAVREASLVSDYSFNDVSKKIRAYWLMADGKTVDPAHQRDILDCMKKNKVVDTIAGLIRGGTEADKLAVAACLRI